MTFCGLFNIYLYFFSIVLTKADAARRQLIVDGSTVPHRLRYDVT